MALKNEKFDSFLKRTLNPKVYQQVKLCEPCVVTTKEKNYAFRFAFFTNEALYITENPPKSILFCISLTKICEVQLVYDTAEFLQKELQEVVQHVLIKYRSSSPSPFPSPIDQSKNSQSPSAPFWKNLTSMFKKSKPLEHFDADEVGSTSNGAGSFPVKNRHTADVDELKIGTPNNHIKAPNGSESPSSNDSTFDVDQKYLQGWSTPPIQSPPLENEMTTTSIEDLHLYILNGDSVFCMLINSVWKACLLKSTQYLNGSNDLDSSKHSQPWSLHKALLDKLKSDILVSFERNRIVEEVYGYFLELKCVLQENASAKAYLWKESDLFLVSCKFLTKFSTSDTLALPTRRDELECMIMICESMSEMLREVESLACCNAVLQHFSLDFYSNFLTALLSQPAASDVISHDEDWQLLMNEFVEASCDLLYELMMAADRMSWMNRNDTRTLSSSSFLSLLDSNLNLISFLKRVVSLCVRIWTKGSKQNESQPITARRLSFEFSDCKRAPLSPAEVAFFYRSFSILHRCLVHCKTVKNQIQEAFNEEFRYYIRPESLNFKFPMKFPASSMTRSTVSLVAALVLR